MLLFVSTIGEVKLLLWFMTASTHDQEVFSFYADHRPCDGFEEALQQYRDLVPNLRLAGLFFYFSSFINHIILFPTINYAHWFSFLQIK